MKKLKFSVLIAAAAAFNPEPERPSQRLYQAGTFHFTNPLGKPTLLDHTME